jgi:hypothetical protein
VEENDYVIDELETLNKSGPFWTVRIRSIVGDGATD